jgi:hypothetical protein
MLAIIIVAFHIVSNYVVNSASASSIAILHSQPITLLDAGYSLPLCLNRPNMDGTRRSVHISPSGKRKNNPSIPGHSLQVPAHGITQT